MCSAAWSQRRDSILPLPSLLSLWCFSWAGFVQAARLSGNDEFRILLGHILPNIMPIMVVQMSLTMGYAILNAAALPAPLL